MQNEFQLPPQLTQNETLPPMTAPLVRKRSILERLVDAAGKPAKRAKRPKTTR